MVYNRRSIKMEVYKVYNRKSIKLEVYEGI